MKNIILIGAPGSGKGTIAEILIKEYGYCHVSTGNLIRDEITAQTDIGKRMKSVIASGALVDADIIYSLVKTAVENARKKKCSVVFDGFPRTMEQVQWMEKFCPPDAVVYLKCDLQTVLSRLCTRRVCPKCNFTTNTRSDAIARKGICAECGTQLITRSDDTPNTITNRYRVFEANNNGIIDYYNKKQILKTINAAHPVKFVINAATTLFKKLIK